MTWREKWEEFKEEVRQPEKAEERKAKRERTEQDPHRIDEATGSECLDD